MHATTNARCLLAAIVLTACAKGADAPQATGSTKTLRVALLTSGPTTDNSWNGGALQALNELRDSLGAQVSTIQTKTPAQFEENMRQYGAQNYDIIFGHGFEYQDAATRVSPAFPKSTYVVTSGRVTGPNLAGISFAFEESSYEAGIVAGAMTKSNVIGLIAGQEFPPVKASFLAFEMGAKSVNPKANVLTAYIGNWEDVSAAKELALSQISRGADIIFQNADAAGLGVFQAAREKKVLTFGTNSNQNGVAPDVIIGSVYINLPKAFRMIADDVRSGAFVGKVYTLGVKQDVVSFIPNPAMRDRIPATALATVDSVHQLLRAGTFRALDNLLQGTDAAKPITP